MDGEGFGLHIGSWLGAGVGEGGGGPCWSSEGAFDSEDYSEPRL